ncbi:MAG: hypothetical protein E4H18_05590, partial [Hyphomicrobiales bacterium]
MRLGAGHQPLDHKLNHTKALIAIMLLAAVLRFWGLGSKSLWLDEIMSQRRARGTFSQMIGEVAAGDAHPPGYYALQWLAKPLGGGEYAVRVPAAVAGVAVVLATYLLGKALLGAALPGADLPGAAGGLAAAAFAAISPFQIYYSQEARPYSLAMLLAALSLWLLLRLLAAPDAAKPAASRALPWIAYTLLASAMLYTHYYLAFALLAEGAILAASPRPQSKRIIKRWLVSRAVAAALFAPYLLVLAQRVAAAQAAPPLQSRASLLASLPGAFSYMLTGFDLDWLNAGPAASAVILAIALVPVALALAMLRGNRIAFRAAVLFVLIPAAAVLALPWRLQVFEPKHLAFVAPMLMILA